MPSLQIEVAFMFYFAGCSAKGLNARKNMRRDLFHCELRVPAKPGGRSAAPNQEWGEKAPEGERRQKKVRSDSL